MRRFAVKQPRVQRHPSVCSQNGPRFYPLCTLPTTFHTNTVAGHRKPHNCWLVRRTLFVAACSTVGQKGAGIWTSDSKKWVNDNSVSKFFCSVHTISKHTCSRRTSGPNRKTICSLKAIYLVNLFVQCQSLVSLETRRSDRIFLISKY